MSKEFSNHNQHSTHENYAVNSQEISPGRVRIKGAKSGVQFKEVNYREELSQAPYVTTLDVRAYAGFLSSIGIPEKEIKKVSIDVDTSLKNETLASYDEKMNLVTLYTETIFRSYKSNLLLAKNIVETQDQVEKSRMPFYASKLFLKNKLRERILTRYLETDEIGLNSESTEELLYERMQFEASFALMHEGFHVKQKYEGKEMYTPVEKRWDKVRPYFTRGTGPASGIGVFSAGLIRLNDVSSSVVTAGVASGVIMSLCAVGAALSVDASIYRNCPLEIEARELLDQYIEARGLVNCVQIEPNKRVKLTNMWNTVS